MNSGILLLDKPTGSSSAKALYPVKRRYPGRKVGHTGTLDPFASGLLVVLVGHATRLSRFFLKLDKQYTGVLKFGAETDTLDILGTVTCTAPVPTPKRVTEETARFIGKTLQKPPSFSALKVKGKRAYTLAREGITPELSPREIVIHHIEISPLDVTCNASVPESAPDRYSIEVHCESGTYIRALARDIGIASGSRAFLEELRRTKVGPFDVSETDPERLLSIPDALRRLGTIPSIPVDNDTCSCLRMGREPLQCLSEKFAERLRSVPNSDGFPSAGTCVLVVDPNGREVALLERSAGDNTTSAGANWKYAAVFPAGEGDDASPSNGKKCR